MKKYFVCSDIHSAYSAWMKALSDAGFDHNNKNHMVVVCGDVFDRMDETVQCFEFVKKMCKQNRMIYIKGNHESLLFDCVEQIRRGEVPDRHHFSNGTVKSICQFCGQSEWIVYDPSWTDKILETMQPVLDFIDKNCVNYFEIGDKILVHSWIPTLTDDCLPAYYTRNRHFEYNPDWKNASQFDWDDAMWGNPFVMAYRGLNKTGKTIVFGHWHCSTGWSKAENRTEFGEDAKFEPFYGDGIIGIDACVAHSGKINCIVIEE